MTEDILSVWILETDYVDGDHELNGVFKSQEKAEEMKEWMKSKEKDMEKKIKFQKISEFLVM